MMNVGATIGRPAENYYEFALDFGKYGIVYRTVGHCPPLHPHSVLIPQTIIYLSSTEPGEPNGVTITTSLPGSNCQRALPA